MLAAIAGGPSMAIITRLDVAMAVEDVVQLDVVEKRSGELIATWHMRVREIEHIERQMVVVGVIATDPLAAAWVMRYRQVSFADVGPPMLEGELAPPAPDVPLRIAREDVRRLVAR